MPMEYPPKKCNIMSKQKRMFWLYRHLIDCTSDHFGIGSFNACLRRIRIFGGRQINGDIRAYSSDQGLFLSWTGEGVNLNPP